MNTEYSAGEVIHWLRNEGIPLIDWYQVNPYIVDALRGTVSELGYRGTLTEYFQENPNEYGNVVIKTIERLGNLGETTLQTKPLPLDEKIGLGTYGWKYNHAIIDRATNLGIKLIDTAETYGYGRVETALGEYLSSSKKDVFIATKVGRNHLSYKSIIKAAQRSLDRLQVKRINLYQIHRLNPSYPIFEMRKAMEKLISDGVIENVGVSNFSIDQIQAFGFVQSVQIRYNPLDRGAERALIPFCKERGIKILAYSPLGQRFSNILKEDKESILSKIAQELQCNPATVVLAWIISKGLVPIPRTNKIEHVDDIIKAKDLVLRPFHIEQINMHFPIKE